VSDRLRGFKEVDDGKGWVIPGAILGLKKKGPLIEGAFFYALVSRCLPRGYRDLSPIPEDQDTR
jgi:hypothetical protein